MTKGALWWSMHKNFGYADIAKPKATRRVSFLPMMLIQLDVQGRKIVRLRPHRT